MGDLNTVLQGLEEILLSDMGFVTTVVQFVYDHKLLFLLFTVPVVSLSIRVFKRLLKL